MRERTLFNDLANWSLTNAASGYVFKHSEKISALPFMACDTTLTIKDGLTAGNFLTMDSLAGAFFFASGAVLLGTKKYPRVMFRMNGVLCFGALGALGVGGLGYNVFGEGAIDPGRVWAAINFIPGAALTLFEAEIAHLATYLRKRSNGVLAKLVTSASRYPLIWTGALNLVATVGLTGTAIANPSVEWPLFAVAGFATLGNIGLIASDRRMAARSQYAQFWRNQRAQVPALAAG